MGDRGEPQDVREPNLELPSFLRRRRKDAAAAPPPAPEAPPATVEAPLDEQAAVEAPLDEQAADVEPTLELSPEDVAARQEAVAAALATDRDRRGEKPPKPPKLAKAKKEPRAPKAAKAPRERKPIRIPAVAESIATAGTGAICGAATLLAGALFLHGCEAIRGVQSCGGGIGVGALVLILGIDVALGAALLYALRVTDAVAISFVATALMAALVVMFLGAYLSAMWMVVVLPLLTGAVYLGSWRFWMTIREA